MGMRAWRRSLGQMFAAREAAARGASSITEEAAARPTTSGGSGAPLGAAVRSPGFEALSYVKEHLDDAVGEPDDEDTDHVGWAW